MKKHTTNTDVRQLQARKRKLLALLSLPPEAMPGSLAQSHYRCGSPNCHCTRDEGHPHWSLTFMSEGKKRVHNIPKARVEFIRERVNEGKAFKQGVAELMVINAQLFHLFEKRDRDNKRRGKRKAGD
ncbi:MAG: hypothetical protein GY906_16005 [bacterium]|nr:hypothetical protein [bacterium]